MQSGTHACVGNTFSEGFEDDKVSQVTKMRSFTSTRLLDSDDDDHFNDDSEKDDGNESEVHDAWEQADWPSESTDFGFGEPHDQEECMSKKNSQESQSEISRCSVVTLELPFPEYTPKDVPDGARSFPPFWSTSSMGYYSSPCSLTPGTILLPPLVAVVGMIPVEPVTPPSGETRLSPLKPPACAPPFTPGPPRRPSGEKPPVPTKDVSGAEPVVHELPPSGERPPVPTKDFSGAAPTPLAPAVDELPSSGETPPVPTKDASGAEPTPLAPAVDGLPPCGERPPVPTKDASSAEPTPLAPVVDKLPATSRREPWADAEDEPRHERRLSDELPPNSGVPVIKKRISESSGYHRVHWKVDEHVLKGKGNQAVSPPFEVCGLSFKAIITATKTSDKWGGSTFKGSKGKGKVELKCADTVPGHLESMDFRMSVGKSEKRGPIKHNFADAATCGLPPDEQEWDFMQYLNGASFMVCVEVRPLDDAA